MMNHPSSTGRSALAWSAVPRVAKIGLAAIALAALPLAIGTFIPSRDGKGSLTSSIVRDSPLVGMLAMLDQRSPGERTKGELADSKAHKVVPHQRALAKVRTPELPETFIKPLFANQPSATDIPALKVPAVLAESQPTAEILAPVGPLNVPLIPIVGGGGVVPPPATPNPPVIPETPVPPAVPEPDTWALMLLGFGATGIALRRRRAVRPIWRESASLASR